MVVSAREGAVVSRIHRGVTLLSLFGILAGFQFGCQISNQQQAAKPPTAIALADSGQGCFEKVFPVVERYSKGEATPQEIESSWNCADSAVALFAEHVQGSSAKSYADTELRNFLQKYFLGKTKITDGMLLEVMTLKQVVLGGDLHSITQDELKRTRSVFQTLKTETLRLLPHITVISQDVKQAEIKTNQAKFDLAMAALGTSLENVGALLNQSKQPYELKHVEALMLEIQRLYNEKSSWKGPELVTKYLTTVSSFKAALLRPPGNTIAPNEWKEFLVRSGQLYSLYLRREYLLEDSSDLLNGAGLKNLTVMMNEVFDLVHTAILAKPNKIISYQELDHVVDEVYRLNIINWKVKSPTLKSMVRTAIDRVFNPPNTAGRRAVNGGLSETTFNQFREGFMGWLDMERVWGELTVKATERLGNLRRPDGSLKPIPLNLVRELWPKLKSPYAKPFEEMNRLFQRNMPLTYVSTGSIIFDPDPARLGVDQFSFDSLNWKAAFARMVLSGFSTNPAASRITGVTKEEFHLFFNAVRQLGVDLNFLDPNDGNVWSSSFSEANTFMLSGDGNDRLSFFEGVDFISFALSARPMSRAMQGDLTANCAHYGVDIFGVPKVTAVCYRERMRQKFTTAFMPLPAWVNIVNNMDGNQWVDFEKNLELTARRSGYSDTLIESTDIDRTTMVMQYIESIFARYDFDKSGTLTLIEIRAFYPLIHDLLREIALNKANITDEETLYALFTYIVRYGAPPDTWTDKGFFQFVWKQNPSRWEEINADRVQILKIIGQINSTK